MTRDGGNVTPLSPAERARRYRQRKRREQAAAAGSGVQADGSWVPEFDSQRPPFEVGNQLSVTTGAWSASQVDVLAAQVLAELMADPATPSYLSEPSYRDALEGWAIAVAICRKLRAWLATQDIEAAMSELTEGEETETGEAGNVRKTMRSRRVASVLDQLHKHETRAMHLRTRLGLDPLSRARLGKDITGSRLDLAKLWAEEDARDAARAQGRSGVSV